MPTPAQQHTRLAIKDLLFTTDFSALAETALPYAGGIARHYGARVYVGHAIPPEELLVVPSDALPVELDRARYEAQRSMEEFLRTAPLKDVQLEPILRRGPPASVLTDIVRSLQIDMLVTATHGRGGLTKLLLGSVAEEIFRSVACPVLTVGPVVANRDLMRDELFEVLCAIDASGSSHALGYAAALASDYGARVWVVHVITEIAQTPLFYDEHGLKAAREEMARSVAEHEFTKRPELIVRVGSISDKVLELAAEVRAGVIVMGAQHSGVAGMMAHLPLAFAHQVIRHAPCPVVTIPREFRIGSESRGGQL